MIGTKSVIAIIPARGGSKGVQRKNIRLLGGKPLIGWSIDAARQSKYIDRVIVSSDDAEIIKVATQLGCDAPFVRPAALAADETPGIDPVLHALTKLPGYDCVVLLQPTSPLRTAADIDGALDTFLNRQAPACVSLTLSDKNPHWMYSLSHDAGLTPVMPASPGFTRRQDMPSAYYLNGAVYIADTKWLVASKTFLTQETVGYVMPKERSVDIDTQDDFALAEFYLGNHAR